jgi:hypothetical protein
VTHNTEQSTPQLLRRPLTIKHSRERENSASHRPLYLCFHKTSPSLCDGVFSSLEQISSWAGASADGTAVAYILRCLKGQSPNAGNELYDHLWVVLDRAQELTDRTAILVGAVHCLEQNSAALDCIYTIQDIDRMVEHMSTVGHAVIDSADERSVPHLKLLCAPPAPAAASKRAADNSSAQLRSSKRPHTAVK